MSKSVAVIAVGLVMHLTTYPAQASDKSMRCGGNLIHAGGGRNSALMYEVLKKCGEPEAKQGNSWIYIQGSMQRVLTFNFQGRLQLIESTRR
ncbi:MAG: DUF2845 domain-containing protein [Woeseiaceae bacterium]